MPCRVKHTLGALLQGKTPANFAPARKSERGESLRVLDPACGSGSFLLGAYQHILDWHRHWYAANEPEKHAKGRPPRVYSGPSGCRLTTAERRRILLNNIYGVDIDPQAVEVTKLSLLLKVLEEESGETLGRNWEMFHERALPDLDGETSNVAIRLLNRTSSRAGSIWTRVSGGVSMHSIGTGSSQRS